VSDGLIGIIGGTGLGDALAEHIVQGESCEVETPFGRPSAKIMVGRLGENKIAFLSRHGEGHKRSPSEVPFTANIFALKKLGVHTIIGTGAVGSLREEMAPGDLVVVEQFIDKTFKRQNTFFENFAAVHCEMAEPVCGRLRDTLLETAKQTNVKVHSGGTYVCIEGPQFSTRAESLMHQAWGGDLVGMTAMPEAKLAREAQMCYVLIALVSDYDCWSAPGGHKEQENKQTLLAEIMANLQTATNNCLELIKAVLTGRRELVREDCRCRKSLDLAVWTDQGRIEPAEKERLKVLFE